MIVDELIDVLGHGLKRMDMVKMFRDGLDGAEKSAERRSWCFRALGMGAGAAIVGKRAYKQFAEVEREMLRIGITARVALSA